MMEEMSTVLWRRGSATVIRMRTDRETGEVQCFIGDKEVTPAYLADVIQSSDTFRLVLAPSKIRNGIKKTANGVTLGY